MKTAIFDLGNVIVYFSVIQMIQQVAKCTGLTEGKVHKLLFEVNLRDRYESGKISSRELYHHFAALSPSRFTQEEFFHALSDIFQPNTDIFPILEQLHANGVQLLLLSNTSQPHIDFLLPRLPILKLFDKMILSFEVGASKPDDRIYLAALKQAHVPAAQCFYTDDIPEYVYAGRNLGIDAEVFVGTKELKEQLQRRSFLSFKEQDPYDQGNKRL